MINLRTGLAGEFELKILKEGTREDVTNGRVGKFKNLIVNGGLDLLGTETISSSISGCRLGTSNSVPAEGQTGLGNPVGSANPVQQNQTQAGIETGSPLYVWQTTRYEFAAGTIDGVSLQEIGIFQGSSPYNMFARALIKDGGGNPTSITLQEDEILQVFYTLRIYPARGDVTGVVTIDSEDFNYALRPANIESLLPWSTGSRLSSDIYPDVRVFAYETQTLGAENDRPTGTASYTSASDASYTAGNYYIDIGGTFSLSNANFTNGVGSLIFTASTTAAHARYQVSFSRVSDSFGIPKTDEKQLRLNNCLRVSWGRYVE